MKRVLALVLTIVASCPLVFGQAPSPNPTIQPRPCPDPYLGRTVEELHTALGEPDSVTAFRDFLMATSERKTMSMEQWKSSGHELFKVRGDVYRRTMKDNEVSYTFRVISDSSKSRLTPAERVDMYEISFNKPIRLRDLSGAVAELAPIGREPVRVTNGSTSTVIQHNTIQLLGKFDLNDAWVRGPSSDEMFKEQPSWAPALKYQLFFAGERGFDKEILAASPDWLVERVIVYIGLTDTAKKGAFLSDYKFADFPVLTDLWTRKEEAPLEPKPEPRTMREPRSENRCGAGSAGDCISTQRAGGRVR